MFIVPHDEKKDLSPLITKEVKNWVFCFRTIRRPVFHSRGNLTNVLSGQYLRMRIKNCQRIKIKQGRYQQYEITINSSHPRLHDELINVDLFSDLANPIYQTHYQRFQEKYEIFYATWFYQSADLSQKLFLKIWKPCCSRYIRAPLWSDLPDIY